MFNYENIPEELKWTKQWCIAGSDSNGQFKVPCYIAGDNIRKADPTNPNLWADFETVLEFIEQRPPFGLVRCLRF